MGCRVSKGLSGVSKILLSFKKVSKGDKAGLRSVSGVRRSIRRSIPGALEGISKGPRGVSVRLRRIQGVLGEYRGV